MIEMTPVGTVESERTEAEDDYWGGMQSKIVNELMREYWSR